MRAFSLFCAPVREKPDNSTNVMLKSIEVNTIMQNKSQISNNQGNKIMHDSIAERIDALIIAEKISEGEFARKLGHNSNSIINRIRKGKVQPSFETLFAIVTVFNVDANWLVLGNGKMYRNSNKSGAVAAAEVLDEGIIGQLKRLSERVESLEKGLNQTANSGA
ncbi:helix-turn-helix transcriptional regulator [Nodularia spumigena CS-336/02]|nr:helix-turn-helix transcriptional regulator [Nodularia spumigena CS-336/02]